MKLSLSKNAEKDTAVSRQKLTDKRLKLKAKLRALKGEQDQGVTLGGAGDDDQENE